MSKQSCVWATFALIFAVAEMGCSSSSGSTNKAGSGGSVSAGQAGSLTGGAAGSLSGAGGVAGSAGQVGGGAGEATQAGGSAGQAGTSGQGGTNPDAQLCAQACDRVKGCGQVDVPACEKQCGKEIIGEGYLNPEIALDYFRVLRDYEGQVCAYKQGVYWEKWGPSTPPANKFDALLDQSEFEACLANETKCNGEASLAEKQRNCLGKFYRWTKERRTQLKACFPLKCFDQIPCLGEGQPSLPEPEPWLAGVPDPLAE